MPHNVAVLYPWPNRHMLEVCTLGTATRSAAQGSVSLLNLFRQLCLLRDFRIIREGESKGSFAGLSQSGSTTEVLGVPSQHPVTFPVSLKPVQVFFWCVLPAG